MSLSCDCDTDYEWWHFDPEYLKLEKDTNCSDCGNAIPAGTEVQMFECYETDEDGNDLPMPDWHHCTRCSEIHQSLKELGYCLPIGEGFQQEALNDYQEMTKRKGDKPFKAKVGE